MREWMRQCTGIQKELRSQPLHPRRRRRRTKPKRMQLLFPQNKNFIKYLFIKYPLKHAVHYQFLRYRDTS